MEQQLAIICQNLTRNFGEITAVDELSFNVEYGKIFGLMGLNGAGKTTSMRIFAGILPPSNGECIVAGYDVYSERNDIKRVTGLLPESSGIYQT